MHVFAIPFILPLGGVFIRSLSGCYDHLLRVGPEKGLFLVTVMCLGT